MGDFHLNLQILNKFIALCDHQKFLIKVNIFKLLLSLGLLCDLVWSDPELEVTGWMDNERGVSYVFGPDVISSFLKKNDLDLICRAH